MARNPRRANRRWSSGAPSKRPAPGSRRGTSRRRSPSPTAWRRAARGRWSWTSCGAASRSSPATTPPPPSASPAARAPTGSSPQPRSPSSMATRSTPASTSSSASTRERMRCSFPMRSIPSRSRLPRHRQGLGVLPRGARARGDPARPRALSRLSPLTVEEIRTSGTIALCKYNKLMVVSPRALVTGYTWQDTLAHEYTHYLITREERRTRSPSGCTKASRSSRRAAGAARPERRSRPRARRCSTRRLSRGQLISFEQMHPSMALLPSQEDAALAFAEVFTAIEYLVEPANAQPLGSLLEQAARREHRRNSAVAEVAGEPFARFQARLEGLLEDRPMPTEMLPLVPEKLRFKIRRRRTPRRPTPEAASRTMATSREIDDAAARRYAHLGQLLRARRHAHGRGGRVRQGRSRVGARSPTLSNQYALSLLGDGTDARAAEVLRAPRSSPIPRSPRPICTSG